MLTVGEILKTAREKKGLTVQDVEKKIRVRSKFLSAIEKRMTGRYSPQMSTLVE
ncbi:MAG: helix-turn-helix domain-containing protein [Rhodocyclaceae bacterium]|nr:helix-turn-helix domain-containing protein [Rhodocyclaceae bacterium]